MPLDRDLPSFNLCHVLCTAQAQPYVVRDQYTRATLHERPRDALFEKVLGGMTIDGAEAVIEQNGGGMTVGRTSERHALLLSTRKRDALLADLGPVAILEDR
ncbi:hypothetical protein BC937DRAFT_90513 [Endogone sp. FLAS-F59071]|nr:hypothetical protein BC937DRAFT_90513 [Endogone sp. FLAS-F59071]|eukprot:RUS17035.1 hypothetical protein BC937DRAFT_90513 [Endogone sp. FLAS-F59071]